MFFGSGNLVFPLQIGSASGSQWVIGFLGLFLTGVLLPFCGLFVIKLYQGNYKAFFAQAGSLGQFYLPLFTLSLLGSFGVVPRCITVAHGGIEYIFPHTSLLIFSLIFCLTCYIVCLKDKWMVIILGKWLTPILLVCLLILIVLGVVKAPELNTTPVSPIQSFNTGFFRGYETMDLFAAFFFSSVIFRQLQSLMPASTEKKEIILNALKPSLMGAILLGLVYMGFVFLGAYYKSITAGVTPELLLPTIACALMGKNAALLIGIIMIFSCLTTAVALNNIFARYLCSLLRLKDSSFPRILLITTLISFLISLLDFKGIAAFLSPVLTFSYPSLIGLTFLSILTKERKKLKMFFFYGILFFMLIYEYL
jgi:LIVCS family branched-chain amino acid:cation transporter